MSNDLVESPGLPAEPTVKLSREPLSPETIYALGMAKQLHGLARQASIDVTVVEVRFWRRGEALPVSGIFIDGRRS